jgi:hypothetical protein
MSELLHCWQCGDELPGLRRSFDRLAECPACGAELHVCRFCHHYDPRAPQGCREVRAEPPGRKDRANFCDWLRPRVNARLPPSDVETERARAEFEALFGGSMPEAEGAPMNEEPAATKSDNPLDELFDSTGKRGPTE